MLMRWFALVSLLSLTYSQQGSGIGINFGQDSNELRSPNDIVRFLQEKNIKKIRLYHSYPETMRAFQGKGIELILSIPNADLKGSGMAWNQAGADWWVQQNVAPYIHNTPIKMVAVGNEVTLVGDGDLVGQTLPAMRNMKIALDKAGYGGVKVSTPLAMDVLSNSWPPSAGTFRDSGFIRPILEFLRSSGSSFMINTYTYFTYKDNPSQINFDYALLKPSAPTVQDYQNGLVYRNLLFQQLDAVIAAMRQHGYWDIPLILSETGWPSRGSNIASAGNAQTYNQNLINLVARGQGTPLRPNANINAYIFALFNENQKGGGDDERNFGLFRPDFSPVYGINFGGNQLRTAEDHGTESAVEFS